MKLIEGPALQVMPTLEHGIDLILSDLPFGMTKNPWDKVIPANLLFKECWRLLSKPGVIVFFGKGRFSARMMLADKHYKYSLVYQKTAPTGFLNAKHQMLPIHEDILIYYKKGVYNPQKTTGHPRKVSTAHHKRNCKKTTNYGAYGLTSYDSTERYPTSILKFKSDKQKGSLHANQKPVALLEYLIKTFSNEGATVLDLCCGSGSTGEACILTGRNFIGIDLDISVATKRLLK